MTKDDDLPVLTQILRTGHADPAEAKASRHGERTAHALDPRTVDPAAWPSDPLVIGHEPPRASGDALVPSFDVAPPMSYVDDRGPGIADENRGPPVADLFVLPQDHDAPQALGTAYDEPEFSAEPPTEAPHDVAREDAAAFTARVRDAVLHDLSARIDTELDARVAQAIHVEVENALARLQASLRTHLAEALKDVVGRAVGDEIARLSTQRPIDGA